MIQRDTNYALVPLHGGDIFTLRENGTVYVPMKQVVEALCLDWSGQYQRMQRHPIMAKGMCILHIPSGGGMQEAVCLPLRDLHTFLVTLNANSVTDNDRRELPIAWQEEAFDAVFAYWHDGAAYNPRAGAARQTSRREMIATAERLRDEGNAHLRRFWFELHCQDCVATGIPTPAIEDFPLAQRDLFDGNPHDRA